MNTTLSDEFRILSLHYRTGASKPFMLGSLTTLRRLSAECDPATHEACSRLIDEITGGV